MIPGLSVVWVILFVLVLSVVLDRLLFKPLTRVMEERTARVESARQMAEQAAARAHQAASEFESRTRAAQAEIYRDMDEKRRAALDERAALIGKTREEVEASLADARAQLDAQVAEAKRRVELDAGRLASAVVERVLGRPAS